ncbi:Fis family transcriptional regulator [Mangrovimonas yunxiaonensis]|uniref:Fis family transcriptional regulator n=1 Tax=Mangrovimonas yunxiaonensis TaxID=1197477 RepID=A0A084TJJ0_9FLAO|nr:sigma-54 dependent transcriptional regulator [Mangrovimonas yunxiaonensis]KFB00876.1 Fis family transcriptional regulator [Mangrovimonas yunxiaonensis]GGH43905.1 acetoacetate metabolism regulatory protein AtoC [Mangrovimonas yunxiaonensis]
MPLQKENILIVDDDVHILELIQRHLKSLNYHTYKAISVKEAVEVLKGKSIDLLITDLNMPGVGGMELIKYTSEHYPQLPKLIVTGYPSLDDAKQAMRSGVVDYLTKPFTKDELKVAVGKSLAGLKKRSAPTKSQPSAVSYGDIIGQSEAIKNVTDIIERVKDNKATVMITGDSGTGKELVARAIHYMGKFASAPFVAVNCGAIPENLLESELFGYVKGAFTGANEDRKGFFQAANKGTIFLDEIGNASMATQLRLLRVLQEKEITRVGSKKTEPIDVRVIAATNFNLKERIEKGSFREDLYYRLTVVEIEVPKLKDRKEDITLLVDKFLQKYGVEYKDRLLTMTPEALNALERYSWPGNIRELENIIQRAVIMCDKQITLHDLPDFLKYTIEFPENNDTLLPLKDIEKQYILKVLAFTENNKSKAAKILQIDRKTLNQKIQ